MNNRIGVMGFGQMAKPIALVLKEAGYDVMVFARRAEAREEAEEVGLRTAQDLGTLAEANEVLLDLLTDVRATRDVLRHEEGVEKRLRAGQILIDMTTSDPDESKPLAEHFEQFGVHYLDAPITGGVIGAREGKLVFMVGGDKKIYDQVGGVFSVLSKNCFYLGPVGSGHAMKLVHNQLSHSTFLAACEAVVLGKSLGLDEKTMIDVFNVGNARSYATEVRFPKFILSGTFNAGATFATVHKDISLVARKARQAGLDLPITAATLDYWSAPCREGYSQEDYTQVLRLMEQAGGRIDGA